MIGDDLAYTLCYSDLRWPMIVNYNFFCKVSSKTTSV